MTETHVAAPAIVSMTLITRFAQAPLVRINWAVAVATPVAGDLWPATSIDQMTTFTGSVPM
jgi:hypothetical protein